MSISEEMAAVTAFLSSDEAGYITGQTLFVNGGLTLFSTGGMPEVIPLQSSRPKALSLPDVDGGQYLPDAYRRVDPAARGSIATERPHNVFIEVTNHCNLLC